MSLRRIFSLWAPALLWAGLLFYMSSRALPEAPPGSDKIAHFCAYALLSALLLRALHRGAGPVRAPLALTAVALATLYGVSDELHQSFVPGRDASVLDVCADFAGAATAAVVLWGARASRRGIHPVA